MFISDWGRRLFFLANGSDSLYLDGAMWTVTRTLTWLPFLLVVLYIILKNNTWRQSLVLVTMLALLVVLTDQVASGLCKPYFHILRPTHDPATAALVDIVDGYRGGPYGFFSSHAANTFGLAIFLSLLFRSWSAAAVLCLFPLASSASRLYLGVHSPLDIAVGMLFGILSGVVVYLLYSLLNRWLVAPRTYYSSAYTTSGYLISDLLWLRVGLAATLLYIAFNAVFLAARF